MHLPSTLASLYHEDKAGDTSIYRLKVNNMTNSCLLRQVREGQRINDNTADIILNGKGEWHGMWGLSPRLTPDTLPET